MYSRRQSHYGGIVGNGLYAGGRRIRAEALFDDRAAAHYAPARPARGYDQMGNVRAEREESDWAKWIRTHPDASIKTAARDYTAAKVEAIRAVLGDAGVADYLDKRAKAKKSAERSKMNRRVRLAQSTEFIKTLPGRAEQGVYSQFYQTQVPMRGPRENAKPKFNFKGIRV